MKLKEAKAEVVKSTQQLHLIEVMQTNQTQLALCRYDVKLNKLIQCHPWIHCRDYMIDAFVGTEDNMERQIYGFKWTKDNPRPDPENASVMLKFTGDGLSNFQKNFSILTSIEEFMGYGTSYPELVKYPDTKSSVVWILGDKRWSNNALMWSLYTYLLKCLTYPIKDKEKWMDEIIETGGTESSYLNKDWLNFIFCNAEEINSRYKNFSGWPDQKTADTSRIHDDSGFVSCITYAHGHTDYYGHNKTHCLFGITKELEKKAA